ncbi:hypothetical protein GCM10007916_24180 [Psychromonas marina]|uniref:Uncharacterized protein n=1 Tax=Psychromonas marina TaxID=88364 RepID=A0ABQ6E1S9_9GAMM|nr:peptidoglycan binding protein CsiV [Psychromonas marina]GLS91349.1 hypothetical protein GCM10007916_24180 [Psychromonas marina]
MNYKTLAVLLLTVTSFSAHAEQRWFEVELLLFQRNVDMQDITEHLSSNEITVDTSNSISLLKTKKANLCSQSEVCVSKSNPVVIQKSQFDYAGNNFKRVGSSHLQLVAQRERLEKHAGFKPLLHMAWQMPMKSTRSAKPINIFAGENLASKMLTPIADETAITTENIETADNIADETTQLIEVKSSKHADDIWAIDGNFKIYLDHYLYIDSQLIISKAMTSETAKTEQTVELIDDENGVQIAKEIDDNGAIQQHNQQTIIKESLFDQNRRLRSEEIHYLDHPLMGIIVQIRKLPDEKPTK